MIKGSKKLSRLIVFELLTFFVLVLVYVFSLPSAYGITFERVAFTNNYQLENENHGNSGKKTIENSGSGTGSGENVVEDNSVDQELLFNTEPATGSGIIISEELRDICNVANITGIEWTDETYNTIELISQKFSDIYPETTPQLVEEGVLDGQKVWRLDVLDNFGLGLVTKIFTFGGVELDLQSCNVK